MSSYLISSLQPSGYFVFHQVEHYKILRSAHTMYLCVLYGSKKKQRSFSCAALTGVFTERYEQNL
jgi:hypothetical protein